MAEIWKSLRVYLVLVAYLSLVKLIIPLVQPRFPHPGQQAQFTWAFVLGLGVGGSIATFLYAKAGFPPMWERGASLLKRIAIPLGVGAASGIPLIILDVGLNASSVAARNLNIPSIHMPLPESLLIYPAAAIIIEILQRLVPVSVAFWLISNVVLRGRASTVAFWVSAAIIAALEPLQQAPLFREARVLLWWYLLYSYALNLVQMYFFRVEGFLASLTQRIGNYAVWHILWGGVLTSPAA